MTYIEGNVPHNKVSSVSEIYIKDNYKTTNKTAMGEALGIHSKSVLRIMNRLGLKRTQKEMDSIMKATREANMVKKVEVKEIEKPTGTVAETILNRVTDKLREDKKVPIIINRNTTVWVSKKKCKQLEDGTWIKKKALSKFIK